LCAYYHLYKLIFAGSLSGWFRSKYPQYVDGAIATSAPIYAQADFQGTNYHDYQMYLIIRLITSKYNYMYQYT